MSWIKVRKNLHEDPAVLFVAASLSTNPYHAVGLCIRFWSWADDQTVDGVLLGVTPGMVDAIVGAPGFAKALGGAGWLNEDEEHVEIPKFVRHMGQSAKKRAQDALRKSRQRKQ